MKLTTLFGLQLYWVSQQIYVAEQLLIKVSLLALYLRVFSEHWFRFMVIVGIVVIVLQDTGFFFSVMVRCLPIEAIWDVRTPGQCLNVNTLGLAGGILNIMEHLIILVLPLRELWKLRLSRRKRIGLAFVFSLGSL